MFDGPISFAGLSLARDLIRAESNPDPRQAAREALDKARRTGLVNTDHPATDDEFLQIKETARANLADPEFRARFTRTYARR